jgi:hypothetical protein
VAGPCEQGNRLISSAEVKGMQILCLFNGEGTPAGHLGLIGKNSQD